jgi:plasmid stability protein
MANLHVRNVPEELYERLQERARAERRSLSAEVIALLERGLCEAVQSRADVLDAILRRRSLHPTEAMLPDSTMLLREDRAR